MNPLVLVLASQLLYYLLIVQTGVVGAFHSHIHDIYTLPIGGILGSLLAAYWRHSDIRRELYFMFALQIMLSSFYPNYSLEVLLMLGCVVGYTTPLLLHIFKLQSRIGLSLGLAISYAIGTALYAYPFERREEIAIILPMISLIALYFTHLEEQEHIGLSTFPIKAVLFMMLWIFADSALFETLSRSEHLDVWRRYTLLIITSHLFGVYLAYRYGKTLRESRWIIWGLFVASYGFYYTQQGLGLAVVYPVAISYYNVLLFSKLIEMHDTRFIAIAMVGVGWMATSFANLLALNHLLWIAAVVLFACGMVLLIQKKGISS
jgi:hypothetical protein